MEVLFHLCVGFFPLFSDFPFTVKVRYHEEDAKEYEAQIEQA